MTTPLTSEWYRMSKSQRKYFNRLWKQYETKNQRANELYWRRLGRLNTD